MRSGTYLNPFLKVFLPLVKAKIVRLWLFFLGVGGWGGESWDLLIKTSTDKMYYIDTVDL